MVSLLAVPHDDADRKAVFSGAGCVMTAYLDEAGEILQVRVRDDNYQYHVFDAGIKYIGWQDGMTNKNFPFVRTPTENRIFLKDPNLKPDADRAFGKRKLENLLIDVLDNKEMADRRARMTVQEKAVFNTISKKFKLKRYLA